MNFLAHIFLSGDNDLLKLGNFSADGVRGKRYTTYPPHMQAGILLHREIDTFTDAHPIVRQSTKRLHKNHGHYSGVIVDIFYDHFLAKHWDSYSSVPLELYIKDFYTLLTAHIDIMPPRFQKLTPFMIEDNWLLSYATIDGIQKVLNGMHKRAKGKSNMKNATIELSQFYHEFEDDFTNFFAELIVFSTEKRIEIETQFNI